MKILIKNKHWKLNEEYNINKILYFLIDRPTRINSYNEFIWENNKVFFIKNLLELLKDVNYSKDEWENLLHELCSD